VRYVDPDGMDIWVKRHEDETYEVVGGTANDDLNIYTVNVDDNRTNDIIGRTLTAYSFHNENGDAILGTIINPNDNSGANFLNNEIVEGLPSPLKYALNAGNGKTYDFKERGIDDRLEGISTEQHRYRGMPLTGVTEMVSSDGKTVVYGSARDVGNLGAGYVTGRGGLTWDEARLGFDTYQSFKSMRITSEGQPTQQAQRIGWENGSARYWLNKIGIK